MSKKNKQMLMGLAITAGVSLLVISADKAYGISNRVAPMLPGSQVA